MVLSRPWPNGLRIALRHRFVLAAVAALLIAFGVATAMAILLPPDGPPPVRLDAIAAALRGTGDATLARRVTAIPPDMRGDRWLDVPAARRQLAALLRVDPAAVRLVVASPVGLRRIATAAAGPVPIRAAMLPFDQADGAAPTVTPPPPIVTIDPPAAAPTVPASPAEVAAQPVPAARRSRRPARAARARPVPTPAMIPVPVPVPVPARPAPVTTAPPSVTPPLARAVIPPVGSSPPVVARPAIAPPRLVGSVPAISGDFSAALRLPAGGWAVVTPRPETTPTTTQQRMILWGLVALAITLPIAWAGAIVLVRPLRRFAIDAERSGRDPAVTMPETAPAELAPVADAIAQLQRRVRSLDRDRTAFAGTVRTDLRAPLDRLRARLDDTPRQIREAFHDDVTDIEAAVAALQLFLSDAAAPEGMTRQPLGDLIRAAAAPAVQRGDAITIDAADAAAALWVTADPAAILRLVDQLLAYVRHRSAAVAVRIDQDGDDAIVTVAPAARAVAAGFAPGLHGKAGRATGGRADGPGLAAARSIARGHGGEVRLVRSEGGMIVHLRLPLA